MFFEKMNGNGTTPEESYVLTFPPSDWRMQISWNGVFSFIFQPEQHRRLVSTHQCTFFSTCAEVVCERRGFVQ